MNIKFLIKCNPAGLILLMVLLVGQLVWQAAAEAASITLSAEFTPNRNNPNNRTFTNTTHQSGVCSNSHQAVCNQLGILGLNLGVKGSKTGDGVTGYGRGSAYLGMPAVRTVMVTSDAGETADVALRVTGMAFRYRTYEDGFSLRSDLSNVQGACSQVYTNGNSTENMMRIVLRNDGGASGPTHCSHPMLAAAEFNISALDIMYAIDTPDPLNMKNGVYRASGSYSVGGLGSDIDIGDGAVLDDSIVNYDLTLTVNHMFALEFPPGSETAVLQPLGGWSQWTDYKKVPATLRKDQHFTVSGSTNFSVNLDCEYTMPDGRCGISNGPSTVPLDVSITMPGLLGRRDLGFAEALDFPLIQSPIHVPRFAPKDGGAVFQRRSYLRFEVNGEPIKEMVTHPGTQYKGRVTVIFDAGI